MFGAAGRKVVASVVVMALVAMAVTVRGARPAFAGPIDQPTQDVEAGLTSFAGFVSGLATNGQFAKPIPTLNLTPGSADGVGLVDVLQQTLSGPLGGNFGGASTLDELTGKLNAVSNADLGDGRKVTIVAAHVVASGIDAIAITVTVKRHIEAGLSISTKTQPFAFSSDAGVPLDLTLTLHVDVNYDSSNRFFWLAHSSTTPSLTFDAQSTGFNASSAKGAIGILGVQLQSNASPADDFHITAHLASTFADPNNDGKLAFAEPNGSGGTNPGELAGSGAPAGIVSTDWAASAGSAAGTLILQAQPSALIGSLPSATATVNVSAPDLSAADPVSASYGSGALDPLQAFERLSPKDLADALGQLAQTLASVQMTHLNSPLSLNLDLPFMKGTLADAIAVNESIRKFLDHYVEKIPVSNSDPSKTVGKPLFSSIQELFDNLKTPDVSVHLPGNAHFNIANASYDATSGHEKLSFSLTIDRAAGTSGPVDVPGAALSSTGTDVTYANTSMTDPHANFDPLTVTGRSVGAGDFTAAILSVTPDHHTLNLDVTPLGSPGPGGSLWKGATAAASHPTDGTAYTVAAADPQTGVVQIGNALKSQAGLININASVPQASIDPSYHVNLPVVLDLSPPTSTSPSTITNPDGTQSVVDQLPTPLQRIKLHTGGADPLFSFDAPITTSIDANATVGFLGVHVTGSLAECTTGTYQSGSGDCGSVGGTHLVSVNLVTPSNADSDGNVTLPNFFANLSAPGGGTPHPENILSAHVNGEAHAKVTLTVPGAGAFFGGVDHVDITVDMANITNPAGVTIGGTDVSKLISLDAFDISGTDPKALFGALLNVLGNLDTTVQSLASSGPLHTAMTTNIPLLGTTVQKLIGGGITGGDGTVYGDMVGGDGKHHGTITDTHLASLTSDQLSALKGRVLTAGTVSGAIADTQATTLGGKPAVEIALATPWAPQPQDGTAYSVEDELHAAIADLQANSADSLQQMLDRLTEKLGANSGLTFSVDQSTTPATLKVDIDWKRAFATSTPVQFSIGGTDLAGAQAGGTISVGITGEITAKLRFPLSAAALADPLGSVKIDPSSGVSVQATADAGSDVFVKANVGPLAIALGDPGHPNATNVEAHAKLGVSLTDGTDSSPVSLGDYASHLGVQLNQNTDHVTCNNAPEVNSQHLALCAALPIYTTSDGGAHWNLLDADVASSSILLRLPQQTGTDLAAQLDPTGKLADGTTDKIALPADLLSKIASAYLDLSSLDDGLLGYLKFAQQALQLASAGGKLPLIGKDLQQGADFIGQIRSSIDNILGPSNLGNGKEPTAGAIRDKITDLGTQLSNDGVLPSFNASAFRNAIGVTCTSTLPQVGTPTVVATNPGSGTTHYRYEVVAFRNSDGTGYTVPSNASADVQNVVPASLGAANFNTVSWTPVSYAEGYAILRSDNSGGSFSTFALVGTATGQGANSFKDDHTTTSAAPATPSQPPKLGNCPDNVPGSEVDGLTVAIDLGFGNINDPASACGVGCTHTTPLDIGIPGLSFKAVDNGDANNGITAAVGWRLHLKFGLSRSKGFFVATQDHAPGDAAGKSGPEFQVGVALDLPAQMLAQLAFLNIHITKHTGVTDPLFKGVFSIDLHAPGDANCSDGSCTADSGNDPTHFLDLGKIQSVTSVTDVVTPTLSANAKIDWDLFADTSAGAALPGVGAEFKLHWGWSSADPTSGLPDQLEFDNVTIDPGQFVGNVLGKILKQIADVTKPIQPIIDTIEAPLPVLSDLSKAVGGGDVSIATLAQTFSTLAGGPEIEPFINVVKKVLDVAKALESGGNCPGSGTFCVNVGSFDLNPTTAKSQQNTPDLATTPNYIQPKNLPADSPTKQLNDDSAGDIQNTGDNSGHSPHPGFSFPALDDPKQIFQLLLGHDVTLAKFDSGPLSLGFSFSEDFGPVYAPPPVDVTISGSAGVAIRIVAGFDTYGVRKAVENKKLDAGVLDSLFFQTTDDSGKPIPVVSFTGSIAAGAEVTLFVLKAGIEGGITLTVNFYWHDPDNDGKFRFSEFLATALNNPICLFDVGGELSLFIKVFITIGIDPFSVSFDFTLVNVKLLDFSLTPNCTPPPPRLGGVSGTSLYIYAGKLGTDGARGAPWGSNKDESWVITEDSAAHTVTVKGLGITHTFTQSIDTVVFDGRGYGGALTVTFQAAKSGQNFDLKTVAFGGNGDDVIRTGSGPSFVDGGPGKDQITTGDRPDPVHQDNTAPAAVVAGGPGDDVITTGNAKDWVAGDGALAFNHHNQTADLYDTTKTDPADNAKTGTQTLTDVIDPATVGKDTEPVPENQTGADGSDLITVGIGGSTVWGGGGVDKIGTAQASSIADANPGNHNLDPGSNTIIGGSGGDQISSGSAADIIFTGDKTVIGPDGEGSVDGNNVVDTGSGNDTVYGSQGNDFVTVHSKPSEKAIVYGGGGNDILDGGDGPDEIYGGPGNDYVIAQPASVDTSASIPDQLGSAFKINLLPDNNPPQGKTLVGGGGSDRIYGGNGDSTIYGDHLVDQCVSPGPAASDPPAEHVNPGEDPVTHAPDPAQADAADLIIGGNGVDQIEANGGNDFVFANGGNDQVCGGAGNDYLDNGSGDDTAFGGTGDDNIFGGDGADNLYGNANSDHIYGGAAHDVIEGNADTDYLFGGDASDTIVGGTQFAGRPDDVDFLYGDAGADLLIGDNGAPDGNGRGIPYDLGSGDNTLGGADWVFGGDGNDVGYGGLENDTMLGGNDDDHFEGNNGADTIYGESGQDELVGGSFEEASTGVGRPDGADTIFGGPDADVITGDNAVVSTVAVNTGTDITLGRGFNHSGHTIHLLDLGYSPTGGTSAGDALHGDEGTDVIMGQGGNDTITGDASDDYAEGGPGADQISGGTGSDDLVGGSSTIDTPGSLPIGQPDTGDTITGDDNADVVLGDNGKILRDPAATPSPLTIRTGMDPRAIVLYDLTGSGATPAASGNDLVTGNDGVDVILGQDGNDRLQGNAGDDYVEGGQASDWIEGDAGDDDLVGGSSTKQSGSGDATVGQLDSNDAAYGGPGDDVITGDNALVLRTGSRAHTTDRIGSVANTRMTKRSIQLFDLNGPNYLTAPSMSLSGNDRLSGGSGTDVMYGQDGNDQMSGGPNGDYLEGDGGNDIERGDLRLDQVGHATTTPLVVAWPGSPSAFDDLEGAGPDGQDDLIGGSSLPAFRDGNDSIEGDGGSDFQLGDNGTLMRDVQGSDGSASERVFVQRYSNTSPLPADATVIRIHDPAVPNPNGTTRFCTTDQSTCEPAAASGDDTMWGDAGDDSMWGQDGNDTMRGGDGADDMYGELGNDVMFGDPGNDAMLGDRGGVVDELMNPDDSGMQFTVSLNNPPKESYVGFAQGAYHRYVDLLHDIDGDQFVGAANSGPMPHAGLTEGGNDRIRGGTGADNIHAGFGDDLANGDSGGDVVFGDDGADVMWGGQGCDKVLDAATPDCLKNGVFDPTSRGTNDRFVDHLFGGTGGTSPVSKKGDIGSDIMDWRPRGTYADCTPQSFPVTDNVNVTHDPCAWFEMTGTDDDTSDPATLLNNQHHQGTDWMYGGWDRDIMQGDVAQNGPNPGDRLLDWTGAYNLYTHCNSAYGGFNDVRQHSPDMQTFLQQLTWGDGAGRSSTDSSTSGLSAFRELAFVYPSDDNDHGSGSAYPSTPGHFDVPSCNE
jgi:Ca2+-binding RTX toxin-like protein